MLAYLIVDLLVAKICFDAQARAPGGCPYFVAIAVRIGGDRGDHRLRRRKPKREVPSIMLDQDPGETLERTEHGSVQHDRRDLVGVLVDIKRAKPAGHVEGALYGPELP